MALFAVSTQAQVNATDFSKFFIIMFENHGYDQVLADSTWKNIVKSGMLIRNYKGVAHPSQPNYVATIGAETLGCSSDSDFSTSKESVVDTMNARGVSWKTYQENYVPKSGGNCNMASSISGKYYRKHNPFMSFSAITRNASACKLIVEATQLDQDIASGNLADFMYYTPNIDNDSHNQPLSFSGKYFEAWLNKYQAPLAAQGTVVFATFDEDDHKEGNHVFAMFWGNGIQAGTQDDSTAYTHASIAKTLQDKWGLKSLGRADQHANSMMRALSMASVAERQQLDAAVAEE